MNVTQNQLSDDKPAVTRRSFLSRTSLAGAGLVLGAPAVLRSQEQRGSANDIHVALIGLGAQGRILLESMLGLTGLHFQAVCDVWEYSRTYGARKIASERGQENMPKQYENFEEMLEKEKGLDAVVIATPDFWHAPQTVACLKAGLNVYCEKMMSNTIEGARSMVKAMEESAKLCQIGHQRRSNPRYIHICNNLLRTNKLCGRIMNINGQWNRAVTEDIGFPSKYEIPADKLKQYGFKNMFQFRNWRWFRDLSGGPISDLGAHQIDIFNWYLGTVPKAVIASATSGYYKGREHFDNVMTIFEYDTPDGEARAFYQVLTTTSAGGGYFERFMGDEGTIKISENPAFTKIYREERAPDWQPLIDKHYIMSDIDPDAVQKPKTDAVDARESKPLAAYNIPIVLDDPIHQPHLKNFFEAVRGKGKLNCDAKEAFMSELCVHKVNPAAASRTMIEINKEEYTS